MHHILTEEQVKSLQEAFRGHHLEPLIRLALATGMRRDELLCLTWQDVDVEKGVVHFQNAKTKDRESFHIPPDVAEMLKLRLEARLQSGFVWSDSDPVFTSPTTGNMLSPYQLIKAFRQAISQTDLSHIRFHDLRATAKKKAFDALKQSPAQ